MRSKKGISFEGLYELLSFCKNILEISYQFIPILNRVSHVSRQWFEIKIYQDKWSPAAVDFIEVELNEQQARGFSSISFTKKYCLISFLRHYSLI